MSFILKDSSSSIFVGSCFKCSTAARCRPVRGGRCNGLGLRKALLPGRSSPAGYQCKDLALSRGQPIRASQQQPGVKTSEEEPPKEDDRGIFHNVTKALRDFGFGHTSLSQGGTGLLLLFGAGVVFAVYSFIRGSVLGRSFRSYEAVIEFPKACGVVVGTPVRVRGVPVGAVTSVDPKLDRVDMHVQIVDAKIAIPRNAAIEANQSGITAEPMIDITPQPPIPEYKAGPLDRRCESEGLIVCHKGRAQGTPGAALARRADGQEASSPLLSAARAATSFLMQARPLAEQAQKDQASLGRALLLERISIALSTAASVAMMAFVVVLMGCPETRGSVGGDTLAVPGGSLDECEAASCKQPMQ
eukprot:CAMPEP_0177618400 /NCGR_PEP_ID=MMETSP0419_2-20121207/25548_1 /TAXON_ID=582737 /ORGANISM="Tetraselmis sp., Strain GSL018" /LENGTH=358 /DNA_ID=CAMNT_0019117281 /DNA_START=299 /DNA_END=1376 /DNA_ORIENTATION=+